MKSSSEDDVRRSVQPQAAPMRRSLFRKYFLAFFAAVIVPLAVSGIGDAWFGYREQRSMLSALLLLEATSAAYKFQSFLDGVKDQLGWTVQQD
ncbi:adenylate/guanylate cyclase domain-containing protein, partial [Rhizobium johnstonii]